MGLMGGGWGEGVEGGVQKPGSWSASNLGKNSPSSLSHSHRHRSSSEVMLTHLYKHRSVVLSDLYKHKSVVLICVSRDHCLSLTSANKHSGRGKNRL